MITTQKGDQTFTSGVVDGFHATIELVSSANKPFYFASVGSRSNCIPQFQLTRRSSVLATHNNEYIFPFFDYSTGLVSYPIKIMTMDAFFNRDYILAVKDERDTHRVLDLIDEKMKQFLAIFRSDDIDFLIQHDRIWFAKSARTLNMTIIASNLLSGNLNNATNIYQHLEKISKKGTLPTGGESEGSAHTDIDNRLPLETLLSFVFSTPTIANIEPIFEAALGKAGMTRPDFEASYLFKIDFRHSHAFFKDYLLFELSKQGPRALPFIAAAYIAQGSLRTRIACICALRALGNHRAEKFLLDILSEESSSIVIHAVLALSTCGTGQSIPVLTALKKKRAESPHIVDAVKSTLQVLRSQSASARRGELALVDISENEGNLTIAEDERGRLEKT
jgi:hypothetical protein